MPRSRGRTRNFAPRAGTAAPTGRLTTYGESGVAVGSRSIDGPPLTQSMVAGTKVPDRATSELRVDGAGTL